MHDSLKGFLHCVGFVSIRDFFKSAYVWTRAFLLLYSFVLLSGFGLDWLGIADLHVAGKPGKLLAYALWLVILIWGVKNRKSVFAELEGIFAGLKDLPGWALALMFGAFAVMVASFAWLPWWAGWGVILAVFMFVFFIDQLDKLSQKYVPPNIDALVSMPREGSVAISNELDRQLRHCLRIAHEYVPPRYSWQEQAEEMRDAIVTLVEFSKARDEDW